MKSASLCLAVLALAAPALSWNTGADQARLLDDDLDVPGENPLHYCANPDDYILSIGNIDVSPNPPLAGKTLNITASGTLSKDVEKGAKIHLSVKYGLIKILTDTVDVCDNSKNVDLPCPIKKGDITLDKEVELPSAIPPGKYTVLADVVTKDGDTITCLEASVVFSRAGLFDL